VNAPSRDDAHDPTPHAPSPAAVAAFSQRALDDASASPRLLVAWPAREALLLGAFQPAPPPMQREDLGPLASVPRFRRASGGASARLGPGVLYVGLSLPHPGALMPATCDQLLNRAVRPILRALTRVAVPTHYFGRDWLSADKRPVGLVAFGHDAGTRRTVVEAFVSLASSALPDAARLSYGGRAPATFAELRGDRGAVDPARVEAALAEAFGLPVERLPAADAPPVVETAPSPLARVEEAIGPVFSWRDERLRVRLGGELMASRDRVAWLEARVSEGPDVDDATLGAWIDEAFRPSAPSVALFGVRSLVSIRDALRAALASSG
jgi:hypothetical protein